MPDIFSSDTIPDDQTTVTVEDLVGEGRKYRDANELAKAYNHADALIAQQKARLAELKVEARIKTDLLNARQTNPSDDEKKLEGANQSVEVPAQKVETPDFQKLVRDELNAADAEKRKANNINTAAETLNRIFGSPAKAQQAIQTKADELGVSFDWLKDTAAASPAAFYRTMEISPEQRSSATPSFSPDFVPRQTGREVKNFAYYETIRKTNPKLFYSPEIRQQMFSSAQELGDRFYSQT